MSDFKAAPNRLSVGAPPPTTLGELRALPRPSSWILGELLLRERKGRGEEGIPCSPVTPPATTF